MFVNIHHNSSDPFVLPRPEAVVVVGLGEEGALRATDLTQAVRQAVLAYAQRLSETAYLTARRLAVSWGVHAAVGPHVDSFAEAVDQATAMAQQEGFAERGDHVLVVAGVPVGQVGTTNSLRYVEVK